MSLFSTITIKSVEFHTFDSVLVEFDVPRKFDDHFSFKSGQHISLEKNIDGTLVRRTYSICEPSPKKKLTIGVRVLDRGIFSSWLKEATPGTTLKASKPSGLFYLKPSRAGGQHNLFIAGGSGITPIVSMLEEFLDDPSNSATLLYGNRSLASSMFLERLMQLKNQHLSQLDIHFFNSQEPSTLFERSPRIDQNSIESMIKQKLIDPSSTIDVYLCGPSKMMEKLSIVLKAQKFREKNIFFEHFTSSSSPKKFEPKNKKSNGKIISKINVVLNGTQRQFAFLEGDESIITSAKRNGIQLPFACRGGMCGTCRARVLNGSVKMSKNYSLEKDDLEQNFVLSCQSHPLTETLSLSFDY